MKLHLRLALPLFGAALMVSIAGTAGVRWLVERVFAASLDQQARQIAVVGTDALRGLTQPLGDGARILALLDGPIDARLRTWGKLRVDGAAIVAPGGRVRSSTGRALDAADLAAAAAAPGSGPALIRSGGALLAGVAMPGGRTGDVVVLAVALDDRFAARLAELTHAKVTLTSADWHAEAGPSPDAEPAAPVTADLRTAGGAPVTLTAWVPAGRMLAARRQALALTGAGGVLLFLAGAGVALWTLARITRPLRELAAAADALAAGGAPVPVPAGAPAEVGALVERFNLMGARLAESRARLVHSAKLSTVGHLVAGISHELNNPLAILLTHAEYALEHAAPDAPGRAELVVVRDQSIRMSRLLAELRGFVRPGDGDRTAFDLNDGIREAVALVRHDAARASVACEALPAADPAVVRASADQLRQALLNLTLNALQATPAGGRIALAVETDGTWLRVIVTDTGPGFPAALAAKLGEPFLSTKPGRMGLGLAITRDIATRHGGRLVLDGRPGGGARATLEFPA